VPQPSSRLALAAAALWLALPALAAAQAPATTSAAETPAIGGHDPVGYFAGAATPGSADITAVHAGRTYRFASAANRAAFLGTPDRYLPQFGGYCAWAASQGRLATPDPKIWRIVDGMLYLNCSPEAEVKWLKDVPGNIAKAEAFWAAETARR
jgi:hypothetical protein